MRQRPYSGPHEIPVRSAAAPIDAGSRARRRMVVPARDAGFVTSLRADGRHRRLDHGSLRRRRPEGSGGSQGFGDAVGVFDAGRQRGTLLADGIAARNLRRFHRLDRVQEVPARGRHPHAWPETAPRHPARRRRDVEHAWRVVFPPRGRAAAERTCAPRAGRQAGFLGPVVAGDRSSPGTAGRSSRGRGRDEAARCGGDAIATSVLPPIGHRADDGVRSGEVRADAERCW